MNANPWLPLEYGWTVSYWLTIEGIPLLLSELDTNAALPDGMISYNSLIVDKSSEVGQEIDIDAGIGKGMPFSFQVAQTNDFDAMMRRWSNQAFCVGAAASDTTINVDSTTGWPSSGVFWCGNERIAYSGKTSTSFTGCTRGTCGSYPSIISGSGIIAGQLTDLPRTWRGRAVRLFATLVDPSGFMPATTLLSDSWEVWRGYIDKGPSRDGALWSFDCLPLDRRLTLPVSGALSGTVVDIPIAYPLGGSASVVIKIKVSAPSAFGFTIPISLAPYTSADSATPEEQITALQASWISGLATAINDVGGMTDATTWLDALNAIPYGDGFAWTINYLGGTSSHVSVQVQVAAKSSLPVVMLWDGTLSSTIVMPIITYGNSDILAYTMPMTTGVKATFAPLVAIAIEPSALISTTLPTSGVVKIGDQSFTFQSSLFDGDYVYLYGISNGATGSKAFAKINIEDMIGNTAEIVTVLTGAAHVAVLRLLESSGTGLRGAYDDLPYGAGYGLDAVDEATFYGIDNLPVSAQFTPADTIASVFGGWLGLLQKAVTTRDSGGEQLLSLVNTAPSGSDYIAEITDDAVIVGDGASFTLELGQDAINTMSVTFANGSSSPSSITFQDTQSAVLAGVVNLDVSVPVVFTGAADTLSNIAANKFIASQTVQTVEVRLLPWATNYAVDVGDLIRLDTIHFGVWSWTSGTQGYAGVARVVGSRRRLVDGAWTLRLAIDSSAVGIGLCPSAIVRVMDSGVAPTALEVDQRFYQHFAKTLERSPSGFKLVAYDPGLGDEGSGKRVTITEVSDTGTACALTVSAYDTSIALTVDQTVLTIPATSASTAYQSGFAHNGAGKWS